ncbi:alpha/beta hydrolase family protein [Glutamicibacter mysorens]|uniref:alpha/beta hydrolase family protein n=1 Tax=Glutamicibacter mysorens TaxID=257984 RepID=UPI0020C74308|nr:hypothetical protein [Glutamicibacter mysorens]UTM48476.1 hypothetical protein XH9_06720 [Glutamicibacter mysorens]
MTRAVDEFLKDRITSEEFRYPKSMRPNYERDAGDVPQGVEAAALRQFTLVRLMAYGVEPGDATRLLEAVAEGASWDGAALRMSSQLRHRQDTGRVRGSLSSALEQEYYTRRSALLRISQTMVAENTDTRQSIYLEAARLFARAKRLDERYRAHTITTSEGALHAWEIKPPGNNPRGVVLVHGGVDGWAMDWDGLGLQIAAEGFIALVLDGPGQGQSRFTHGTYLRTNWIQAYGAVIEYMRELAEAEVPLFAVGNSMAAGMMLQIQSVYGAFDGVCSNGPVKDMSKLFAKRTYAVKLASFCGKSVSPEVARNTFRTIDLSPERVRQTTPVLLLQGDEDPMVTVSDGHAVLDWTDSADPYFALFERGEHVINRFPADKHMLIRSWLNELAHKRTSRIGTLPESSTKSLRGYDNDILK